NPSFSPPMKYIRSPAGWASSLAVTDLKARGKDSTSRGRWKHSMEASRVKTAWIGPRCRLRKPPVAPAVIRERTMLVHRCGFNLADYDRVIAARIDPNHDAFQTGCGV